MWCLSVIRKIREDVGLSVYPAPLQTPASAQKELEMLPVRGLDICSPVSAHQGFLRLLQCDIGMKITGNDNGSIHVFFSKVCTIIFTFFPMFSPF